MTPRAQWAVFCVIVSYVVGLGLFFAPWIFGFVIDDDRELPWLATILGTTVVLNVLALWCGRGGRARGAVLLAWLGLLGDVALVALWLVGSALAVG